MATPSQNRDESYQTTMSQEESANSKRRADRRTSKMHTHADPTLAISEAQPSAIALQKSNLESIRAIQHKDRFGNLITDPDISNPTRHRLERPLDTIKAFEAAINGTYNSRRLSRAGEESVAGYSRPSSYVGAGGGGGYPQSRGYNDYGGRGYQSRPDSYGDAYNGSNHNPSMYGNQQNARAPRALTRPNYDNGYGQNPANYQPPAYPQAYDNNSSPSGSGVDQWVNSTDPSSVNSSLDRLQQQQQQQGRGQPEAYGSGYGALQLNDPRMRQPQTGDYGGGDGGVIGSPPPPPPVKDLPAAPSKNGIGVLSRKEKPLPSANVKRKSWFKRLSKT